MWSGLWVHLVLVQSDFLKTELPAETQAVEITNDTPRETHEVTEDYNLLWRKKKKKCWYVSVSSHIADVVRVERDWGRWEKSD